MAVMELNGNKIKDDDAISIASTATNSSINSRQGRRRSRKSKKSLPSYKFDSYYMEDHNLVIYGVIFNYNLRFDQVPIFATVGSNRCSIYECAEKGGIQLLLCYADPDTEESFYSIAWTYYMRTLAPLLAVAGQRGVIRIIDVMEHKSVCNLIGHGGAINQLKVHPKYPYLLLSCSKDYAIRLWNIETHVLIAVFSGIDGHRAEVLSIDFDLNGERIISSGMDHALKLWNLNTNEMETCIENSKSYSTNDNANMNPSSLSFPTIKQHYPNFSSRDIHGNYVDCVRWFGDFIISKSCQNTIVIWKIDTSSSVKVGGSKRRGSTISKSDIIAQFKCQYCELWFVRFDFNIWRQVLAVGNQFGKIYIWEFAYDGPQQTSAYTLTTRHCKANIRDVAFSKDAAILIAVCDDGTIWRWNRFLT